MLGTYIKDIWTKPKGGRIEGVRWGWLGWGGLVGGRWRQLYLNNNKKKRRTGALSLGEGDAELMRVWSFFV